MKYYFQLQYTRLIRWLTYLGINPVVGFIASGLCFIGLSIGLFHKTEYASWIYLVLGLSLVFKLCETQRNDFLEQTYSTREYRLIRLVENSMASLPFLILLGYEGEWAVGLSLIFLAMVLSFYKVNRLFRGTIPTPFKRLPFEFTVGFRKTFWLIGICYFLIAKALQVDNYYLGLFGLASIFLTSLMYYQQPEDEYFVWIHSHSPAKFLKKKILTALTCVSILSVLALVLLIIGFSAEWLTSVVVYLIGSVVLATMVLTKYSGYPREIGIPQGILFALSVIFPPMLLIAIWMFYSQSIKRLNVYLEC